MVGTGPWMLDSWEPNVKIDFVRNPNYFVPGLPYADSVESGSSKDPASRLASLAGRQERLRPGVSAWSCAGATRRWPAGASQGAAGMRVHVVHQRLHRLQDRQEPVQGRAGAAGASRWPATRRGARDQSPGPQGQWAPNPASRRRFDEWSIPIDQLTPEGRKLYEFSTAGGQELLAEAGHPNGFKTRWRRTPVGYGPDFDGLRAGHDQELEGGGHRRRPQAQGVRRVHLEHDLRQVRRTCSWPARGVGRPRHLLHRRSCPASRSTSGA